MGDDSVFKMSFASDAYFYKGDCCRRLRLLHHHHRLSSIATSTAQDSKD